MKRDMDLLRNILLSLEKDSNPFLDVYAEDNEDIYRHVEMLMDAGFIEGTMLPKQDGVTEFEVERLTFAGCEYMDSIRNDKIWHKVKDRLNEVGGAPLEIVKEVAMAEIRQELRL